MRLLERQDRLASIISILLLCSSAVSSVLDQAAIDLRNSTLEERGCEFACGWHTVMWCACGQQCLTHAYNNQVYCGAAPTAAGGGGGQWTYYTETYVQTDQVTYYSTYSSWIGSPVTVDVTTTTCPPSSTQTEAVARCNSGSTPCGSVCCYNGDTCMPGGYCASSGASYTAPVRVTSSGLLIITNTVPATRTAPFESAVATNSAVVISSSSSGGGGLSGGAIAGIVIGVIVALAILIILCLIFCVGAAADGILSFFGLRNRRRRRRVVEEKEVYYDHDSRASDRRYIDRRRTEEKRGRFGNWGGIATVGAGLVGLAAALGIKRRYDRRRREREDDDYYSNSSYDYSYSGSSDRRTRDTRRSGR